MAELPSPEYMAKHENDDRRPTIYGVCSMFMVLATTAVMMRLGAKFVVGERKRSRFGADDYLAILSLLLLYALCASSFAVAEFGIGRRAFTVSLEDNLSIAKGFLAFELAYPCLTFAVKMTVLMLYHNIFRVASRLFLVGWWWNVFLAFSYTISLIVDTLTQCKTVPELWNPNAPPGDCRTGSATSLYVFAGLNAFSDLCILSLPVPIVWKLQMTARRKLAILSIFFLGFIAVLISFIRIYSLKTGSGSTADPTYDQVDGLIWTVAEPATGLICSCLPVMRPAIMLLREKYRSSRSWLVGSMSRYGSSGSYPTQTVSVVQPSAGTSVEHLRTAPDYPLDQMPSLDANYREVPGSKTMP